MLLRFPIQKYTYLTKKIIMKKIRFRSIHNLSDKLLLINMDK